MRRRGRPIGPLSQNAQLVLKKRYLRRDDEGRVTESPEEMLWRVAQVVSLPEGRSRALWARKFFDLMASFRFLPNSPTLMNAGKHEGQLSACYVLPIEDSLRGIFESLKQAALIHQSGGGTGFSFSMLRPKGSLVRSTEQVASGPVSFIRIFDSATETIKQGGTRRGANMAVLAVTHPDVMEFIDAKRDQKSILNFNVSVGVTDEFMRAVFCDADFSLRDPRDGRVVRVVRAADLLERMAQAAWECGDPGLIFLDRINAFNPTPSDGLMEATNPCGEQPLLPYESCNLGSINLVPYVRGGEIDWKTLARDTWAAARFLDNVIEVNHFTNPESRSVTLAHRKVGLGVMGLADLLLLCNLRYDSPEARELGGRLMGFIDREAKAASAWLAGKRNSFKGWNKSLWARLGYPPLRNASVTTVAPTGTISLLAGVSSGIEPIFAARFRRNVLEGESLSEIRPGLETLRTAEELAAALGPAWCPAHQVSIDGHLGMQATFQRYCDSAVSKTINLPESVSVQDVERAFRQAYLLGCKGITVYRDKSRKQQVLEDAGAMAQAEGQACPAC